MVHKDIKDDQLLTEDEVLQLIRHHLTRKQPFSFVRIGDGENIVMGQGVFLPLEDLPKLKWLNVSQYKSGERGVSLPNLEQRDRTIAAVKKASLVGICRNNNDELIAANHLKRELTNEIFAYYQIEPAKLCHVCANRKMVAKKLFWELLHRYRTLLVSRWAPLYRDLLKREYQHLRPRIVGCVEITNYQQIPEVMEKIGQFDFDLALVSAGTSAVILVPEIAERYGKVALDFGHVMAFTLTKDPRVQPWRPSGEKQVTIPPAPIAGPPPGSPQGTGQPQVPKNKNKHKKTRAKSPYHYKTKTSSPIAHGKKQATVTPRAKRLPSLMSMQPVIGRQLGQVVRAVPIRQWRRSWKHTTPKTRADRWKS